jgi:hypothetical protein
MVDTLAPPASVTPPLAHVTGVRSSARWPPRLSVAFTRTAPRPPPRSPPSVRTAHLPAQTRDGVACDRQHRRAVICSRDRAERGDRHRHRTDVHDHLWLWRAEPVHRRYAINGDRYKLQLRYVLDRPVVGRPGQPGGAPSHVQLSIAPEPFDQARRRERPRARRPAPVGFFTRPIDGDTEGGAHLRRRDERAGLRHLRTRPTGAGRRHRRRRCATAARTTRPARCRSHGSAATRGQHAGSHHDSANRTGAARPPTRTTLPLRHHHPLVTSHFPSHLHAPQSRHHAFCSAAQPSTRTAEPGA